MNEGEMNMNIKEQENIKNALVELKEGMIEYMGDGSDVDYAQQDIDACMGILDGFLNAIQKTDSKEAGLKVIKDAVMALNELNQKCDDGMIETGERELIAGVMIEAGHLMGCNSKNEDVTEEWREW